MDKVTTDRLQRLTPQLLKFLELHPDEQRWLFPLLGRAEQRAIRILEEVHDIPLTYDEVGKLTDSHPKTVKQTLHALSAGGANFRIDSSNRWMSRHGGRKRKLVKL